VDRKLPHILSMLVLGSHDRLECVSGLRGLSLRTLHLRQCTTEGWQPQAMCAAASVRCSPQCLLLLVFGLWLFFVASRTLGIVEDRQLVRCCRRNGSYSSCTYCVFRPWRFWSSAPHSLLGEEARIVRTCHALGESTIVFCTETGAPPLRIPGTWYEFSSHRLRNEYCVLGTPQRGVALRETSTPDRRTAPAVLPSNWRSEPDRLPSCQLPEQFHGCRMACEDCSVNIWEYEKGQRRREWD